jgi:hypothetical protein
MTQQMQRLISRVDGLPSTITPVSIIGPSSTENQASLKAPTPRAVRPRRRKNGCPRADWMSGRVPPEIERLALTEATEIRLDLVAAGLM